MIKSEISDGYHTFNDLYDHRNLLFIDLCLLLATEDGVWEDIWYKEISHDGYFCLYAELAWGQVSYHIPHKFLYLIKDVLMRDENREFDGHTSDNVLSVLIQHCKFLADNKVIRKRDD